MAKLTWDDTGKRFFESGVSKGVLYVQDKSNGTYKQGVAWNGLTNVTKSPEGAEPSPQYADNIKYLELVSAEEFKGTIEAFTYPDEFIPCDGGAEVQAGVEIGQQDRSKFGFVYRTEIGNDVAGQNLAYKIHIIYGCTASPSEKGYATINDSPEAAAFSWSISATKVPVEGHKPTATITVDSRKLQADKLKKLEDKLFGSENGEPTLPSPTEVFALVK